MVWEPIPGGQVLKIAWGALKKNIVPNVVVCQPFMQPTSLSCNPGLSVNKGSPVVWEPIPRGQVL